MSDSENSIKDGIGGNTVSQIQNTTPPNYVFKRQKRTRDLLDDSVTSQLNDFKEEMRQMIKSLLSEQESELKKITPTLQDIQKTNTDIQNSITFLTTQNTEFNKKIEALENQIKEDKKYITLLEDKVEDLQKGSRKANFEMKNVPKKKNETREDLVDMVVCLSNSIDCKMEKSDIKDIYRVRGKKEGSQNTPIVVESSSTLIKTNILKLAKSFNKTHKSKLCAKHLGFHTDEDTPIYITEQLTAKGARLHFLARDLAKSKQYKFCWTAFGKIYVRKDESTPIIMIKN